MNTKTTLFHLLGVKSSDTLTIKSITFHEPLAVKDGRNALIKLDTPKGDVTIIVDISKVNDILNLNKSEPKNPVKNTKNPPKSKSKKKQNIDPVDGVEIVDEDDWPNDEKPEKKKRRIRCPLTDKLISSDQYHKNKKAGMYVYDEEGNIIVEDKTKN